MRAPSKCRSNNVRICVSTRDLDQSENLSRGIKPTAIFIHGYTWGSFHYVGFTYNGSSPFRQQDYWLQGAPVRRGAGVEECDAAA
jgi:hypothetical protein